MLYLHHTVTDSLWIDYSFYPLEGIKLRGSRSQQKEILGMLKLTQIRQKYSNYFSQSTRHQHSQIPKNQTFLRYSLQTQTKITLRLDISSFEACNIIYNFEMRFFNLQLINQKILMKPKPSQSKRANSLRSINELELDNDRVFIEHHEKVKKQTFILDPTIASFSQNQISTAFLTSKSTQASPNEESSQQQNIAHKKSRKSNKKKYIDKNIILRSRDRNGKSSRISKCKEDKRRRRLQRKAQKLKQKLKLEMKKQKKIQQKSKPLPAKLKPIKLIKAQQKEYKIDFDDCAQIRHIGFDRKQLQKKRDDLMKRVVDDWLWIQKSRSETRQLRTLNI